MRDASADGSSGAVQGSIEVAATTAILAVALVAAALVAVAPDSMAQPGERIHFVGERFAVRTDAAGEETLVIHDARGLPVRTVSLATSTFELGPDGTYALLAREASPAGREVEIFDAAGGRLGGFAIDGDRALALGTAAVALFPRTDHAVGGGLDVEFRTFAGGSIGRYTAPEEQLNDLAAAAGAPAWLALGVDASGIDTIHLFDAGGALRWRLVLEGASMPVVGLAPDLGRAAVGVLAPDLDGSRFLLVDGSGGVIVETSVPAFREARFSADGASLALIGRGGVALHDGRSGARRWAEVASLAPVAGQAAAFTDDGQRLLVLEQPRRHGSGPEPLVLRSYDVLGGTGQPVARALDALPASVRLSVLDLRQLADGALRVTTQVGIWRVEL